MSDPLARTIAFQSPQQRPRECVWNLSGLGSFSPPPQAFRDWLAYFPRIHIVCCLKRFFFVMDVLLLRLIVFCHFPSV